MSTSEWDAPQEKDDDAEVVDPGELGSVPPGSADEDGEEGEASEMRGGTTEGGWSNVAEEGGASGAGLSGSPPGTEI